MEVSHSPLVREGHKTRLSMYQAPAPLQAAKDQPPPGGRQKLVDLMTWVCVAREIAYGGFVRKVSAKQWPTAGADGVRTWAGNNGSTAPLGGAHLKMIRATP